MTKIFHQLRHPDASPTAFTVCGFIAVLIAIEATVFYFHNLWMYGIFLISYIITTIYLAFDIYFVGVDRIDMRIAMLQAKMMFSAKKEVN